MRMTPNRSLQRTFDPPPIFATAKTAVASNAAELKRYAKEPTFITNDNVAALDTVWPS